MAMKRSQGLKSISGLPASRCKHMFPSFAVLDILHYSVNVQFLGTVHIACGLVA